MPSNWRYFGLHSHWAERLFLVVFVSLMRLPGFGPSVVEDWDEGMIALVAREVLNGGLPYVSIFQEKPLGSVMLFAAALHIFGQSIFTIRLVGTLCVIATSLILREIARAGGLSRPAAIGGALFYAYSSVEQGGMASNIEILLAPFTAGAVWLALRWLDTTGCVRQYLVITSAGLLIGLGIWIKFLPALPGCALFALLVGHWLLRGFVAWPRAIALAFVYLIICLLPTLLTGVVYAMIGHWDAYWYSNFGFLRTYAALSGTDASQDIIVTIVVPFVLAGMAFYLPALFALIGLAPVRRRIPFVMLMLAWFAVETVAVALPGKYWDHYFLLLLPPLCLLAAQGLDHLLHWHLLRRVVPAGRQSTTVPTLAIIMAMTVIALASAPRIRSRFDHPDPERQIAAILRADPAASVWVINQEPVIYFLANLPLPTIYAFPPHLVSDYSALIRTDPEAELRRILANRPRYLVLDPSPVKERWLLPRPRDLIMQTIATRYDLHRSFPGRFGPVLLYKLRD